MKNKLFYLFLISSVFVLQSCSNDDDGGSNDQTGVNQSLISGWWYRGEGAPIYKAYYFGTDGEYKQDGSNFGINMGIGTWSWETETKIKVVPISGIFGGTAYLELTKLTNDSLVGLVGGQELKLSRTNHD